VKIPLYTVLYCRVCYTSSW